MAGFALLVAVSACNHSAPFATGEYGAVGPYRIVDGEGQLTTGGAGTPAYALDGRGIFLSVGAGPDTLGVHGLSVLNCLTLLPSGGGSGLWNRCGGAEPVGRRDSTFVFAAEAFGPGGKALYAEIIGPRNFGGPPPPPWPFPTLFHGNLWLGDSSRLPNDDRLLMPLYHDSAGYARVPPDSINWVANAEWAAADTFFVIAQNLSPADVVTPLGLARGVITDQGFVLHSVPGTTTVRLYALTDGGHMVVFADTGLVLWKVAPDRGAVVRAGELPPGPSRSLVGLSCAGGRCVVVSHETAPNGRATITTATLWLFALPSGTMTPLRTFTSAPLPGAVALSPVNDDVVFLQGGQLYLLPGGAAGP